MQLHTNYTIEEKMSTDSIKYIYNSNSYTAIIHKMLKIYYTRGFK